MQYMRPFNPNIEDIEMYLEEAKERGLTIPNQNSLREYAARVNAQNQAIIERDEKAINENRLREKLEEDKKAEEKKLEEEKRKRKKLDYQQYLQRFNRKYGLTYKKDDKPSPPAYTGWQPRIWSTGGVEIRPNFQENNFEMSNFDIVVDTESKSSFPSDFPKFNSTWADLNLTIFLKLNST